MMTANVPADVYATHKSHRSYGITAALLFILCAGAVLADPRPVGLAGASYGKYEVQAVIKNAITLSDTLEYVYESRGDSIPAAEFGKYSLVVIAHSVSQPLTPADNAAIQKYVEDGGHILLINSAPNSLGKEIGVENIKWLGARRVAGTGGVSCQILKPSHPFLKGVFDTYKNPKWLKGSSLAEPLPGFETLIGPGDGRALVGVRHVGKGWTAFLGDEFFRLKPQIGDEASSYITMLRNIVAEASPLTQAEVRARALKSDSLAGKTLLVWNREWQRNEEYGPQFDPVLPAEKECITSLSADMAVGEVESLQLNITPLANLGNATAEIVTGAFPRAGVEFFVQDRPDPIPWPKDPAIAKEAPYWLMPPEYVEPKGKPEFVCPRGQTRVLWLRLSSATAKPGRYDLTLNLSFAGGQRLSVPVAVTVYPVRLPRQRPIKLEAAGQVYGDVNGPAPALRFANNLEAHGVEWSMINVIRLDTLRIAGTDNKPDHNYYSRNAARFDASDYPALDCSAWDEWMDQSISHGLIQFKMADVLAPVDGQLGKTNLPEETKAKIHNWFSREIERYLSEKGVRLAVLSYGDELNEKEIRGNFIPWAKPLNAAGWGCTSSFTGSIHLDPALNNEIYPCVRIWTLNRSLAPMFMERLRAGELKIRPDAIIGTYGAGEGRGSEHRKPLSASRFLGWESWKLGIRNCAVNPYFKGWIYYCKYENREIGIAGERWVSYLNKDDLSVPVADCPFLEGIRDGMEEGNLCAILSWYLDRLDKNSATAAALRAQLDRVLGGPDAILKWQEGEAYKMKVWRVDGDNEAYRKAKREVLELLAAVRGEAMSRVKPSLFWNDIPLVKEGRFVAAIYSDKVDAAPLAAIMEELGGVRVPVQAHAAAFNTDAETVVVVGVNDQNPLLRSDLGATRAGSYIIRELPAEKGKPRILFIAGPDEAGTRKGMEMFSKFLRAEGNWLLK